MLRIFSSEEDFNSKSFNSGSQKSKRFKQSVEGLQCRDLLLKVKQKLGIMELNSNVGEVLKMEFFVEMQILLDLI